MISYRSILLALIVTVLAVNVAPGFAAGSPHLQLTMIGNSQGKYYAPAGQTTQLKMQILNVQTGDVYLVRGDIYLDPNSNGKWQLVHSEGLDNFHLNYLRSAIWTFDLAMPSSIQAPNATSGVPQVVLLIQIVYSTANGSQQMEEGQFVLSVPGATVRQADYSIWLVAVALVAVVILSVLEYRRRSKKRLASHST